MRKISFIRKPHKHKNSSVYPEKKPLIKNIFPFESHFPLTTTHNSNDLKCLACYYVSKTNKKTTGWLPKKLCNICQGFSFAHTKSHTFGGLESNKKEKVFQTLN